MGHGTNEAMKTAENDDRPSYGMISSHKCCHLRVQVHFTDHNLLNGSIWIPFLPAQI